MSNAVHDLKMPSFGADMAEGTLVKWRVKEGEQIERGYIIAEIETNKGIIELDIFEDAVIEKLLLQEGELVAVGTPIARLRSLSNVATAQQNTGSEVNIINTTEATTDKKTATEAIPGEQDFILQHRLPALLQTNIDYHCIQ